jgi:5-methylcytosine-specific restriction endonuclease McrA
LEAQPLICAYSGTKLTPLTLQVDHKIPLVRGGDNSFDNLCLSSQHMNLAKGQMTFEEFTSLLALIKDWEDQGKSLLSRLKQGYY